VHYKFIPLYFIDLENFKGPDGILLCYKTNKFNELARKNSDLPNDGRFSRQVNI